MGRNWPTRMAAVVAGIAASVVAGCAPAAAEPPWETSSDRTYRAAVGRVETGELVAGLNSFGSTTSGSDRRLARRERRLLAAQHRDGVRDGRGRRARRDHCPDRRRLRLPRPAGSCTRRSRRSTNGSPTRASQRCGSTASIRGSTSSSSRNSWPRSGPVRRAARATRLRRRAGGGTPADQRLGVETHRAGPRAAPPGSSTPLPSVLVASTYLEAKWSQPSASIRRACSLHHARRLHVPD